VPELAGLQEFSVWWKHNDSIRGSDLFCAWYFASEPIGKGRLEQKSLYNFGKQADGTPMRTMKGFVMRASIRVSI